MDKVLEFLGRLNPSNGWKLGPVVGPDAAVQLVRAIQVHVEEHGSLSTMEQLEDLVGDEAIAWEVYQWAEASLRAKEEKKKAAKTAASVARTSMKVRYLLTPTLVYFENDQGVRKWRFNRDHRGISLAQAQQDAAVGSGKDPAAIPLLSQVRQDREDEGSDFVSIPPEEVEKLARQGLIVSQGKHAWNINSWAWRTALEMFPNAVDMTAYNHGLLAPTIPDGIRLGVQVRLKTITTIIDGVEVPRKVDGSGLGHPSLIGDFAVQFRKSNPRLGIFGKGILVPYEGCVRWEPISVPEYEDVIGLSPEDFETSMDSLARLKGAVEWRRTEDTYEFAYPEIWVDWLQVKGKWKALAKERAKEGREAVVTCDMGFLQRWDSPGEIDWCFEILENLPNTPEAQAVIRRFVDEAFAALLKGGVDKLAAKVAKDSAGAALAVEFVAMLKGAGKNYSPLTIPWLKEAIDSKLGRILWWIGQGAGKTSERYVVAIDAAVPPGKAVLAGRGMKPGTKLAAFRFPVVLSQVLTVLEVTQPLPHHLVGGKVVPYTIFMNPHDITARMMGDDDGDTVGVSTDPDLVSLFSQTIDPNIYLIEPEGEAKNIPTGSAEGNLYMSRDQRGEVGKLTILRSRLLAVGDIEGALALSLLIQEAIDKAKRVVKWSDFRFAVYRDNWSVVDITHGYLKFKPNLITEYTDDENRQVRVRQTMRVDENGHINMGEVYTWVYKRLEMFGVPMEEYQDETGRTVRRPANVLGWRMTDKKKRVDPNNWHESKTYQWTRGRSAQWCGGNLVHYCWDYGAAQWEQHRDKLTLGYEHADLAMLVHELLAVKGINVPVPTLTWDEYKAGLRQQAGVQQLGQSFASARRYDDDQTRYEKFDEAVEAFWGRISDTAKFGPDKLATIWYMECKHARTSDPEGKGNINYAYYAVAWDGSPIMTLLGKEPTNKCGFLDQKKEAPGVILKDCLASENPMVRLGEILKQSTLHALHVKDESGAPVPGWACPDCTERLEKMLVRKIRTDASRKEHDFAKALVRALAE